MVNGYPSETLLPFARKYLNPSSVNTSTDGATATTFTFDSPVYLQEGIEYCLVLYSDSVDYTAYVARLGETTLVLIEQYHNNQTWVYYLNLLIIEHGLLNKWKI